MAETTYQTKISARGVLVLTRHEVTGHTAEFPEETLPAWRARGWVPIPAVGADAESLDPQTPPVDEPPPTDKKAARRRADNPEGVTRG